MSSAQPYRPHRTSAGLFFSAAFLAAVLCPRSVNAGELVVGGRLRTIQSALDAARPGDTIRIPAGLYPENLVLDKPVALEGIGRPVIHGSGKGSVILIRSGHCAIRGLVIEHSGRELQEEDSGVLVKSDYNQIENNELRDILYGIYLYHAVQNAIRHNTITGRRELEMGERGAGLHLWDSPDNVIEDNFIAEARDGLYIQSSPGNRIRRNRVTRLRYGVHYMFSNSNVFEDNTFSYCVAGAAIMYSSHIDFRRNAFVHNRGFSSFGILFQDCEVCLAEGNFIIDNATGIFMEALRNSAFLNNVIADNDVALQMFSSAEDNVMSGNNFVQNLSPLQLIGRTTTTRWNDSGRGNYWSDYDGIDLDGNGIGDVPYRIQNVFEYMEGNYPRLRLYLDSPAAQAMAAAEKAFPVLHVSSELDRAPLMRAVRVSETELGELPARRISVIFALLSMGMLGFGLVILWGGRRI